MASTVWVQGKGKRPLPLHPIPSSNSTKKCQECARSKMSGIPPTVHANRRARPLGATNVHCGAPGLVSSAPFDRAGANKYWIAARFGAERFHRQEVPCPDR